MKKYKIIRHIYFYAVSEEVTHGRLKIFYQEEAISRFLRDGFIEEIKEPVKEEKSNTIINGILINFTDNNCLRVLFDFVTKKNGDEFTEHFFIKPNTTMLYLLTKPGLKAVLPNDIVFKHPNENRYFIYRN